MFVKPGPDRENPGKLLKVRDPVTLRLLPDEGSHVPYNSHWLRVLSDGDVVLADEPTVAEVAGETA